jgi:hypothetical protein
MHTLQLGASGVVLGYETETDSAMRPQPRILSFTELQVHPPSHEISSVPLPSVPTKISRDGSSGYSSVPRSVVYIMVYSSGDSIFIPNATLFNVAQFAHLIVQAIPAEAHVIDPVTGANVRGLWFGDDITTGGGVGVPQDSPIVESDETGANVRGLWFEDDITTGGGVGVPHDSPIVESDETGGGVTRFPSYIESVDTGDGVVGSIIGSVDVGDGVVESVDTGDDVFGTITSVHTGDGVVGETTIPPPESSSPSHSMYDGGEALYSHIVGLRKSS